MIRPGILCLSLLAALATTACVRGADLIEQLRPAMASALQTAAAAKSYRTAAAHDPHFNDKTLWPMLTGKEAYISQEWPKQTRLLVWARPGESGTHHPQCTPLDPVDPANWLENGKPATELVIDEDTDLLLPASEKPYTVGFRKTPLPDTFRHITIESGASFVGGGDGRGRRIYGNVWIKQGGQLDAQGATEFLGQRHTFVRNDNVDPNPRNARHVNLHRLSQYFVFNKAQGVSTEFLGHVIVLDEFKISGCTVIVGPDSRLQPGRSAQPVIERGGVLALMDGAYFGSWVNNFNSPDLQVTGTIQGGTPDRPLKRPAYFGLAFKNHTNDQYTGPGARTKGDPYARVPSLVLYAGSAVRSYASDPAKARLRFSYMPGGKGDREALYIRPLPSAADAALLAKPEGEHYRWFDALPRGVDVWLADDVVIEGVEFTDLRAGGLMCQSPSVQGRFKDVLIDGRRATEAPDRFSVLEQLGKNGRY